MIWSIRRNYHYYLERIFLIEMHMRQKTSKKIVIHKSFHVNHHFTHQLLYSFFLDDQNRVYLSRIFGHPYINASLIKVMLWKKNRSTQYRRALGLFRTTFVYYHTRSIRRDHSRILENVYWTQFSLCRSIAYSPRSNSRFLSNNSRRFILFFSLPHPVLIIIRMNSIEWWKSVRQV